MPNTQDNAIQQQYERALAQFEKHDHKGALSTVQNAIDALMFQNVLNASLNQPKIAPGLHFNSLNFDQSLQLSKLDLLKARIQEPMQQEGAYGYAIECVKRCKILIKHTKMPDQQVQAKGLLKEAELFAKHVTIKTTNNRRTKP